MLFELALNLGQKTSRWTMSDKRFVRSGSIIGRHVASMKGYKLFQPSGQVPFTAVVTALSTDDTDCS